MPRCAAGASLRWPLNVDLAARIAADQDVAGSVAQAVERQEIGAVV